MSVVSNLINKKLTTNNTPTVLCGFYDGWFDNELSKIGLNLIGSQDMSIHKTFNSKPFSNIKFIEPNDIDNYSYDFIICNDIIKQRDMFLNYTRKLHIPGFIINHEPFFDTEYHLNKRLNELNCEIVYTEYNKPNTILYGVEEIPNITKDIEVLIEGNFQPKDYPILQKLHQTIPGLVIIGNNPGFSISKNLETYEEYRNHFARCKIFVNLPTKNNITYPLLWSMSNGALILSLKTTAISNIINDYNGILFNHPNEIPNIIKYHQPKDNSKTEEAKKINQIFSMSNFKNRWEKIIHKYIKKVYTYGH